MPRHGGKGKATGAKTRPVVPRSSIRGRALRAGVGIGDARPGRQTRGDDAGQPRRRRGGQEQGDRHAIAEMEDTARFAQLTCGVPKRAPPEARGDDALRRTIDRDNAQLIGGLSPKGSPIP